MQFNLYFEIRATFSYILICQEDAVLVPALAVEAVADEEVRLRRESHYVQSRRIGRLRHGSKINRRGNILQTGVPEWIRMHAVPILAAAIGSQSMEAK